VAGRVRRGGAAVDPGPSGSATADQGATARPPPTLVVLSESDPVARAVEARWGTAESTGVHVDGAAVRQLEGGLLCVRRPGPHLYDERLDLRLPGPLLDRRPTLVFPSIHRSESKIRCFTVHPLGNPGGQADHGGRPRTLVPTDPWRMTATLRGLAEEAGALGLPATFEATHHGPELGLPAFFAEVALPEGAEPSDAEVSVLAKAIRAAVPDPRDRVALAVGGGHYAPRFTDLAMDRRWAFGHILCRHAFADLDAATTRAASQATPKAEGVLYARAQDRELPAFAGLGPALRETDAPRRDDRPARPTSTSSPTSGT